MNVGKIDCKYKKLFLTKYVNKFVCMKPGRNCCDCSNCVNEVQTQFVKEEVVKPVVDVEAHVEKSSVNGDVLTSNIRSHAFNFSLSLNNPRNWDKRELILKANNIGFRVKNLSFGNILLINYKGFKIWFGKGSIVVYFPQWKSYFVDEARKGFNYAISDFLSLVKEFELMFDSSFKIKDGYKFKISRQHHALIHNSLAKMYNRDNKKLEVFDKNGFLWLIIDNSEVSNFKLNELECVDKDKSVVDSDEVVNPFFNQLRDTRLMPNDVLNMFKEVASIQKREVEKMDYYAENLKTHVNAINVLANNVDLLTKTVDKLDKSSDKDRLDRKVHAKELLSKYGW